MAFENTGGNPDKPLRLASCPDERRKVASQE